MTRELRERLHEATLQCARDQAFGFSVEDVATAAGVSRATIYRHFPGGRDQLIEEGVTWEVARFFSALAARVEEVPDLAGKIEVGLVEGRRLLDEHVVLHGILRDDPEQFLARLEGIAARVFDGVRGYAEGLLARERLVPGVEVPEAADYLARLLLSFLGHPGSWDLHDPEQVHELVATQFLPGIVVPPASS